MEPIATAAQVQAAEQAWWAAHPGKDGELMQRAAAAVAEAAAELLSASRRPAPHTVVVLAGRGNNAGDGLHAAAELARIRPGQVQLLVWAAFDRTHPEGLRAALGQDALLVSKAEVLTALPEASLVIDALMGLAGRAGLDGGCAEVAQECAHRRVPVVAVDLPSGLAADGQAPLATTAITATRTVTFVAHKPVHLAAAAAAQCGEVQLADLGVPVLERLGGLWSAADVAAAWPVPTRLSHKYSRGVVGLDVGSAAYPGAGVLASLGAVYSGAGMVRFVGPDPVAGRVLDRLPSVVTALGRVQAWVCGSGWGRGEDGTDRLRRRLDDGVPLVIDADALSLISTVLADGPLPAGSLLTPHAGELAALLGTDRAAVEAEPIAHARQAANSTGATVLLKGAHQFVVPPHGELAVAVPGPAWTAQAGSGDVLAGVCGTLLAAGLDPVRAGSAAASLQALTAARHPGPWPPDRLATWFPETIAAVVGEFSRVS